MSEANLGRRYFKPQEAANYLGISVWSLYRLVSRRSIPFIALRPSRSSSSGGRASLRFDALALDRWMQKQVVRSVSEPI